VSERAPAVGEKVVPYSSWRQTTGYFDGDGNVGVEVVRWVLRFKLRFVDTLKPQIESLASFFAVNGLSTGSVGEGDKRGRWQAAYRLDIVETRSVLAAAKAMVNFSVKKKAELQVVIDYLEGRLTGDQAIRTFNGEVRSGRRRGKVRKETVPYTREEGLRIAQLENARRARAAYAVEVKDEVQEAVRRDHRELRIGYIRLSKKYGYSVSVIRRVLGAR
jgi:hypothetical protein